MGGLYKLFFYIVFLFAIWILRINLLPVLDEQAPTDFVVFYISNYIKLLLWVAPLLIILIPQVNHWIRMFGLWPIKTSGIFSISMLVLQLGIAMYLDYHYQPAALLDNGWIKVGSIILLGPLVEEIVFRGYIFTEMSRYIGIWPASFASSVLFALIHFPIWTYQGLDIITMGISSLAAIMFGIVACILTFSSKSLYPAYAAHSLNNLIAQFL